MIKHFNIAKIVKSDGYQHRLVSMVYTFFDNKKAATMRANKSRGTFTHTGTGINSKNKQLAEELHKLIIKKFKNCKIYTSFKDNIWGTDLADMQLIS